MARFGIQAVQINGTIFGGVSGFQYDVGSEIDTIGLDGLQYETMHHETAKKPTAEITTRNLKNIINVLNGSTDLPQVQLDGSNGLLLVGGKSASAGPGYASGSVHIARRMARGVLYLSGARWSAGSKAEFTLRAMGRGAGTGNDNPVVESLIALPTQPVPDFGFTLSALNLNGTAIASVNSVDLSIEPNYDFEYLAGNPTPVDITGAGVRKELAITLRADIGDADLGAGTGVCSLVFTRYAQGGGYGTDTVTFTLNSRWSQEQSVGGQSNSALSRNLLVRTRWDGTTKPLTWAVA
jgi:Phage tail tube protein